MKKEVTQLLIPKKSVGFLPLLCGMCLFLFTSFLIRAQERVVSGNVKDDCGQPMPVAGVSVKSNSNDVTTDADGKHFMCLIIKTNELNQI